MNTPPDSPIITKRRSISNSTREKRNSCPPSFFADIKPIDIIQSFNKNVFWEAPAKISTRLELFKEPWKPGEANIIKKKISTREALNRLSQNLSKTSRAWNGFMNKNKLNYTDDNPVGGSILSNSSKLFSFLNGTPIPLDAIEEYGFLELDEESEADFIVEDKIEEFMIKSPESPFERFFNENLRECVYLNYESIRDTKHKYLKILTKRWNKLSVKEKSKFNYGGRPLFDHAINDQTKRRKQQSASLQKLKFQKMVSENQMIPGKAYFLTQCLDINSLSSQDIETEFKILNLIWDKVPEEVRRVFAENEQTDIGHKLPPAPFNSSLQAGRTSVDFLKPFSTPFDHYASENKTKKINNLKKKWESFTNFEKSPFVKRFMSDNKHILTTYERLKTEGFAIEQFTN